jgi:hypothetical protein
MKRSAPSSGYGKHGEKAQYRRVVWSAFRNFTGTSTASSHALLMPSREGHEITSALTKGFRADHLHVVDRNPAIVAHLSREHRGINTYGVDLGRAAQRIEKSGVRLSVANIDLCGPSETGSTDVRAVFESGVMADDCLVSITALRGRERGHVRDVAVVAASAFDRLRVLEFKRAILSSHYGCVVEKCFRYKSAAGSQTMLVVLLRCVRLDFLQSLQSEPVSTSMPTSLSGLKARLRSLEARRRRVQPYADLDRRMKSELHDDIAELFALEARDNGMNVSRVMDFGAWVSDGLRSGKSIDDLTAEKDREIAASKATLEAIESELQRLLSLSDEMSCGEQL